MSEKVTVIVAETAGRERHYRANDWERLNDGGLAVQHIDDDDDALGAEYAPGAWLSVRYATAEVPDATVRALGTAQAALRDIADRLSGANEARRDPGELLKITSAALDEIFAETEL